MYKRQDLLLYGDLVINEPRLIVPHPRMTERLFVLQPLLELVELDSYTMHLNNNDFTDQQITRLRVA